MLSLEEEIKDQIQASGPIPFSRFMETALFFPKLGYYSSGNRIGQNGDYYTSPASHPLFAKLLGIQFQQMWVCLGKPPQFNIVEVGAGSGILHEDLVTSFGFLSRAFQESVRYIPIDRCRPTNLQPDWVQSSGIPLRNIVGCVISNELFDSFPVHRFQIHQNRIFEIYVNYSDGEFVEVIDEPSQSLIENLALWPSGCSFPDGFRGEVSVGIDQWFSEVRLALDKGFILTLDYGGTTEENFKLGKKNGTIQCYYDHTVTSKPLIRIGKQDITAHVNFSRLSKSGRQKGFTDIGYTTQREFLINLGANAYIKALSAQARMAYDGPSSPKSSKPLPKERLDQNTYFANRMGMETLLHRDGLGNFKVLCQGIGTGQPTLWGFHKDNSHYTRLHLSIPSLKVPMKDRRHTPLLEGRYPHLVTDSPTRWDER